MERAVIPSKCPHYLHPSPPKSWLLHVPEEGTATHRLQRRFWELLRVNSVKLDGDSEHLRTPPRRLGRQPWGPPAHASFPWAGEGERGGGGHLAETPRGLGPLRFPVSGRRRRRRGEPLGRSAPPRGTGCGLSRAGGRVPRTERCRHDPDPSPPVHRLRRSDPPRYGQGRAGGERARPPGLPTHLPGREKWGGHAQEGHFPSRRLARRKGRGSEEAKAPARLLRQQPWEGDEPPKEGTAAAAPGRRVRGWGHGPDGRAAPPPPLRVPCPLPWDLGDLLGFGVVLLFFSPACHCFTPPAPLFHTLGETRSAADSASRRMGLGRGRETEKFRKKSVKYQNKKKKRIKPPNPKTQPTSL